MTKQELFFLIFFVSAIDCADSSNRLNLHHLWLFFFFYQQGLDRGGRRAMEEIERKKKRAKRKRETCSGERKRLYKFFGLRNKYRMY